MRKLRVSLCTFEVYLVAFPVLCQLARYLIGTNLCFIIAWTVLGVRSKHFACRALIDMSALYSFAHLERRGSVFFMASGRRIVREPNKSWT